MVSYYGDFAEDDTVLIPFNTFSSNDPSASVTITNLVAADIMVHKDGGLTQIATDGATVIIDFDGVTGNHLITIDTSAHADYATGSEYAVRIEGATVDAGTVNAWVGAFSLERAGGALAITKLIQAAVITNAAGVDIAADVIALKAETAVIVADTGELQTNQGNWLTATGFATPTNITAGTITNVTTVNGLAANVITAASMNADASAEIADAVWDEDATAHQTQGTFGQAIGDPVADTDTIWGLANTNLDAAVSSRMATYAQPTGFLAATFPTGTVSNTTNITAATGVVLSAVTHTGAVIPVVTTVTTNTDMRGTDNAALASVCTEGRLAELDAANLPTDIADIPTVAEFNARTLLAASYFDPAVDPVANVTLVATTTTNTDMVAAAPTVAAIADAVWDEEITTGHVAADSAGAKLNAAGGAADPWATALPGAYGAGTAGEILGDWKDAGRLDAILDNIVADTGELQTNQGNWLTATGFATPTNITAGTITTVTNVTNAPTTGDLTATMKTSVTTAATAATPIAASVTGAVGSVTGLTASNLDATVSSRMATTHLDATAGKLDGVALADTVTTYTGNTLQTKDVASILPVKNAAFNDLEWLWVAASDHVTPVTGATTMSVTRSIDGGAFGSGTGTGPTEVGHGIYVYDASAADMNGTIITFRFVATGGTPGAPDDAFLTIKTSG